MSTQISITSPGLGTVVPGDGAALTCTHSGVAMTRPGPLPVPVPRRGRAREDTLRAFRIAAAATLSVHTDTSTATVPAPPDNPMVDVLLGCARKRWTLSALRQEPPGDALTYWQAMWTEQEPQEPQDRTKPPEPTAYAVAVWHDTLSTLGSDPAQAQQAAQGLLLQRQARQARSR